MGNFLKLYWEIPSISQEFTCWLLTLCGNSNDFCARMPCEEADPDCTGHSESPRGKSEMKINCFLI